AAGPRKARSRFAPAADARAASAPSPVRRPAPRTILPAMIDFTPLLRRRARRRLAALAALDPARAQEAELMRLVRRAQDTRFGRDHGFAAIDGIRSYQARVPMRRYEDFRRDYWRADFPSLRDVSWPGLIPYFALSSGTTADVQKYVP